MTRIIVTLIALGLATTAAAQEQKGNLAPIITSMGLGNDSCGSFLEARRANSTYVGASISGEFFYSKTGMYEQWMLGFATATSISRGKEITTDADGIVGWVQNYCEKNPADNLITTMHRFFMETQK